MLDQLRQLQADVGAAIDLLTKLDPVVRVWQNEHAVQEAAEAPRMREDIPAPERDTGETVPASPEPHAGPPEAVEMPPATKTCAWCGQPFTPARGSSGNRQKFCCEDHRIASNSARARAKRIEAQAAKAEPEPAPKPPAKPVVDRFGPLPMAPDALPEKIERPMRVPLEDDTGSRAALLKPPALPWEQPA